MKRTFKIYWLNFAVLLTVIALSAVSFKGETKVEPEKNSPVDGRYHWADIKRDILLEIKNGEYTETEQTGDSAIRTILSRGYCFQSEGRLLLSERETDRARSFEPTSEGLRELSGASGESREFERCVHPGALIERGENPYSVDGVQLGMSMADVEARWGELNEVWCAWNVYSATTGSTAHFDNSGRVHYVSGAKLYEFSRPLSEEELRTLGHSDPLYFDFGSSSYEPRIAGDYQIAIFSPDERGALEKSYLPKSDPFEADRMPESQPRVSLGYRR